MFDIYHLKSLCKAFFFDCLVQTCQKHLCFLNFFSCALLPAAAAADAELVTAAAAAVAAPAAVVLLNTAAAAAAAAVVPLTVVAAAAEQCCSCPLMKLAAPLFEILSNDSECCLAAEYS